MSQLLGNDRGKRTSRFSLVAETSQTQKNLSMPFRGESRSFTKRKRANDSVSLVSMDNTMAGSQQCRESPLSPIEAGLCSEDEGRELFNAYVLFKSRADPRQ